MQHSDDYVVLLTTVPDEKTGQQLARQLVKRSLAACVNLLPPMLSIYFWDGEVQSDNEQQMVIKTHQRQLAEIESLFATEHPYDVPEFITLPITAGSKAYLTWLSDTLNP